MQRFAAVALTSLLLFTAGCNTPNAEKPKKTLFIGATADAPGGKLIGEIGTMREPQLQPGKVPDRVRYKVAADDVVAKSAAILRAALEPNGTPPCGKTLMVFPGAWSDLQNIPNLSLADSKPASFPRNKNRIDEGRVFFGSGESTKILAHLRSLLGNRPTVRAFKTQELARWWIFIPFDIEEPIFVVESGTTSRRYIFSFSKDGEAVLLDELSFYQ